jgi:HEAT repeat protein
MRTTWVRVQAVCVLGVAVTTAVAAQTPAQWQDVIRNLRHPTASTRLAAVERLGQAAYAPAAEAVAPLLTDPDDRVQVAAIESEITFFQATRLSGSRSLAQAAFEAGPLARGAAMAPALVIDRLIAAMRDENARVRFDAVHALGFLAEPPLADAHATALAAELDHYDPIIRAATARVLGRLRVRPAGPQLVSALNDSNAVVRLYATEALGLVGDGGGAIALRGQLPRARGDLLEATFLALARVGAREDVEFFRVRLADRNDLLRRAAVEGVGRGEAESTDRLAQILKSDRAATVRAAAAFALSRAGRTESHTLGWMLADDNVAAQARDYLLELGASAAPGLHAALKAATDGRHRADLVLMIGHIGTPDDVALLQSLASDRDERVRTAVGHAIQRLRR